MIPGLMGDKGEGGGGFVMPNLFLVFLMSLGIVASEKPVRSHRPADTKNPYEELAAEFVSTNEEELLPNEGVPNYLWEDPLALLDVGGKKVPQIKEVYEKWLGNHLVGDRLCLVVGLPSGSSEAAVEKRIRIRSAVSSALLAKEKYYYHHGASLQVAKWDFGVETLAGVRKQRSIPLGYSRLYRPFGDAGDSRLSDYRTVFLLYVDEGAWGGDFGKQVLQLFEEMRFDQPGTKVGEKPPVDWAFVGLTNSHRLREFVEESYESKGATITEDGMKKSAPTDVKEREYEEMVARRRWEKFRVITPHATIDEEVFFEMFWLKEVESVFDQAEDKSMSSAEEISGESLPPEQITTSQSTRVFGTRDEMNSTVSRIDDPVVGSGKLILPNPEGSSKLRIERLMADDGLLSAALIKELEKRHVSPREENEDGMTEAVLLLSEMDSFYGRSIAKTFREQWESCYPDHKDILVDLHYQLGLDGHEREPAGGQPGSEGERAAKLELAEGRSQIDSVTRLVGRIRTLERMKKVQFKAIGVLGSDVYDKLLLLRALKPEFHEARFFTTDLDARLWQGPERKSARNLIVASSPLFHAANQEKLKVPPFRSHYQLGIYQAVLSAMNSPDAVRTDEDRLCRPSTELGMYEIGKDGPVFLGGYRQEGESLVLMEPGHKDLDYPLNGFSPSHFALLMTMILLVLLYCSWPHLTPLWRREVFDGKNRREWSVRDRVLAGVYLVTAVYLASLVVCLQKGCPNSFEPVRLMDGVSVWPTVIFNVLISMLAVCWLVRSWKILDWSHNNLRECFPFNTGLKVSPRLGEAVDRFDRGGTLKRRLMRTGFLFVVYIFVYRWLLMELPSQNIENLARGEMAANALENSDMISHVFMALLLFFICDAVFHFSRAIHFGKTMVKNGHFDQVYPGSEEQERKGAEEERRIWNKPGMSEEEIRAISAALENGHPQPFWQTSMLELGMRRSQTIGSLLYYPFICLFFLFIARNTIFDDFALSERLIWTYLLMFSLLAGAIVYSQYALKRLFLESSAAIRAAIQSNPEPVAKYYQEELDGLHEMQEKATYGIFNNPLFKAAIIPIGGSGILEMVSQIAPVLRGG